MYVIVIYVTGNAVVIFHVSVMDIHCYFSEDTDQLFNLENGGER